MNTIIIFCYVAVIIIIILIKYSIFKSIIYILPYIINLEFLKNPLTTLILYTLGRPKSNNRRKPWFRKSIRSNVPRRKSGREGDRGGLPELRGRFLG